MRDKQPNIRVLGDSTYNYKTDEYELHFYDGKKWRHSYKGAHRWRRSILGRCRRTKVRIFDFCEKVLDAIYS